LQRRLIALATCLAASAALAPVTAAQPGPPAGPTFPEQPGSNVQTACQTLLASPSQGPAHQAPIANQITFGNFIDACFGG
jgi:hypothetical protein